MLNMQNLRPELRAYEQEGTNEIHIKEEDVSEDDERNIVPNVENEQEEPRQMHMHIKEEDDSEEDERNILPKAGNEQEESEQMYIKEELDLRIIRTKVEYEQEGENKIFIKEENFPMDEEFEEQTVEKTTDGGYTAEHIQPNAAHASADNNQLLAVGAPSSKNHDDELNASHPLSSSLSCNLQKNFNQKTLKCNFCNKSFARKSSLKGHITLIHTGEEGTLSSKTYCGKSSRSKNDSNNDIRIHREEGSSPIKNSRKIVCEKRRSKNHTRIHTAKEAQLQSGNLKCNFCEKSFSRKSSLKGHITLMHSEEEILDSGKSSLPKNSLKSNITTHKKGKSSPIKSSSEIFGKKSRLKDNVRINPEETQFKGENLKCDYCDKKFSRKSSLIGHMTLFHSEKGTSGCENFDKSSQPKNSLKRDITRHKEEKKSPLEDKILSRKRSLEGQITLKHSEKEILDGEKISQAENCLESDITVHKEEKKSPTEEKSLSCKSSLKDQITLKHSEQKTLDSGNCKKNLQPGDCLKTDTTNHKEEKTSPLEKSTKISGETSCLKSKETKFQSKTLKCNFCEKTFSRESSLKCHITLTHSEEKTLNSKNSDISPLSESCSKPVIKSETKISHSENHNISSPPKKSLKNHVSTLTEEKTLPNCDKIVENSLEKHLEENLIQVDDINKISPSKSHLKKQRTLTAENALLIGNRSQRERCLKKEVKVCKKETFVQCEICGKTISSKSIKPHLMIHRGERPFQCEHCKKCFTRKPHLEEHIRMHTGERPFKCDFCERTFLRDAAMRVHLRIHTGVKPFQCTLCEYSFAQKTSLDKHLMTHTKEKPFKCEHCLKGFSRKPHLIDHIRIHTGDKPFKCDTCGRTFTTMTTLYTHVRIHTGEKPYQCEFCDRSFSQMNSWRYHVRCIHTGDKVFQCEICDEKFTRKLLLNKHIAIHHENDESKKPKQ